MAVSAGGNQDYLAVAGAPSFAPVLAEEALVDCIERRRPAFIRMAAAMLGAEADAEDVVQEAALSAVRARAAFRSDADVCTWFHRICLNACYQALRRRSSRPRGPLPEDHASRWEDPTYTVDPEAVVVALEAGDRLRAALGGLTPEQRLAVVLHDVDGWKAHEIARLSGTPLATVKSHLRRGRQALVSLLGERDHGD